MRTIQSRFAMLIMAAIFVSVTVVGVIATATAVQKTDADAVQIINLTCQNEAQYIDATLNQLETSVDVCASYASSILESPEKLFSDDEYRSQYTAEVERVFQSIADDTDGAVAFYYRYNADTAGSTDGFLYLRSGVNAPFEDIPPTDIKLYDPDDDEHVGWYYIPLRNGRASWLDPYQNLNLDIYMISYVVPLYVDGTFVGVIGMDINFQVILDQLGTIRPLNHGYALLCDKKASVMFNSHQGRDVTFAEAGAVGHEPFEDVLAADNNGEDLVEYTLDGVQKRMAFQTLRNGMVLGVVANASDIEASRNTLILNIAVVSFIILVVSLVLALAVGRRLSQPLNELTETARQVAVGNLDAKLPHARSAEVATLIGAYRVTVDHMREQMDYIEGLAHHDSLTHLWNKTAYDERAKQLDQAIRDGEARFAIVMVDVNDLKYMNDEFGHDRGNKYLLRAARLLREAFGEERVYRIGGDEFIVILQDEELGEIEDRLARLNETTVSSRNVRDLTEEDEPWKDVSLAYGYACFDPGIHANVADVFEQADAAMYTHKRSMKANG